MTWPFGDLAPMSYDLIMADPPWDFETWSDKGRHKLPEYATMSLAEIAALPVSHLARGDCVLFLWTTYPFLPQALNVMAAWGFRYVSGGTWLKRTKNGKLGFGTGYRTRSACEPWLLGTVGNPITSKSHRNLIEGVVRQHSRKPESAYEWCESYLPHGLRRLDLFSRQSRKGWDGWGHEVGKFDAEVAA